MALQMTKTVKQGDWVFRFRFVTIPPDRRGNLLFELVDYIVIQTPWMHKNLPKINCRLAYVWGLAMDAWASLTQQMRSRGPYRQANKRKRKR